MIMFSNTQNPRMRRCFKSSNILILEESTFEQTLSFHQNLDPDIKQIRSELENSEQPLYELRNGLVYG